MQPAAAAPVPVPGRETFSVGHVLSRAASVWIRNAPLFVGFGVLVYGPSQLLTVGVGTGLTPLRVAGLLGSILFASVLGFVMTALITFITLEQMRGRSPGVGEAFSAASRRLGPLFAASFVTGILLSLLFCALVVPGLYFSVRWALVGPVVMAEGDVSNPRARSDALVTGHAWGFLAVILLVMVGAVAVGGGLGALVGKSNVLLFAGVSVVVNAVFYSFLSSVYAVAYSVLRSEKEGVDLEQLGEIFG